MFAQYPSDKDDIDYAYSDLELLVRFNATGFSDFMKRWNESTGQHFEALTKRFTWMLRPSMAIRSNGIWWALWTQTTTKWWWWKRIWTRRRKRRSSLGTKTASQSFFMRRMWRWDTLKSSVPNCEGCWFIKGFTDNAHESNLTRLRINRLRMRWRFTRVKRRNLWAHESNDPARVLWFSRSRSAFQICDGSWQEGELQVGRAEFPIWRRLLRNRGGYVSESGTSVIVFAKKRRNQCRVNRRKRAQTTRRTRTERSSRASWTSTVQ